MKAIDMTDSQRAVLPDSVRTNGATPDPWWADAVVYQIYPRSFQDSNGDGMGDLRGIDRRLPYLASLGVDVIWLSPVYKSPQCDNGYDIADYEEIDPLFGTMDDMDSLLAHAHRLGLRVIMDLVVNHTSDKHPWFQASRNKDDPPADWYWWRPARPGHTPGTAGAEPNRWGSSFGGSAWTYDPRRGEYYLHTFSKKQPDLNWENPQVRKAVYRMMNWWMDRGIDGFRMDVITLISKTVDPAGRLPGEAGSRIKDLPVGEEGYSSPWPFSMDGPRLDEYLKEMRKAVFTGRSGYMTVGEGQGITPDRNRAITDPRNHELDMLFLFDHVDCDQDGAKWNMRPLRLTRLKKAMDGEQKAVGRTGWASLYFDNHDQPRSVSRWGDDGSAMMRTRSAKALALLLHMHRGTPYIYQGEELGMTNAGFTRLDQYRDIESINAFHQRVERARIQSADSMMEALARVSRDNSRTPMQWDDSKYAGFEDPSAVEDGGKAPWISVNPNKDEINAAAELKDPDSVLGFYKRLIGLRHTDPIVAAGDFRLLDPSDEHVYDFTRTLGGAQIITVVNVSGSAASIPSQALGLLRQANGKDKRARLLISTDTQDRTLQGIRAGVLDPWMAFALETETPKEA